MMNKFKMFNCRNIQQVPQIAVREEEMQSKHSPVFVYILVLIACIGGFLFGYDTGVISGAMILLKDRFGLSTVWQEAVVAITVALAAVFALIGGFATEWFGRKKIILLASILFTIGSIVLATAMYSWMLLVGRAIVGMSIGFTSMAVPMYIAEAAPVELRGRLITTNNLFITGGQFFASILDGAFYYVPQGEDVQARIALLKIKNNDADAADEELISIKIAIDDSATERSQQVGNRNAFFGMLKTPYLRRALVVGCGLQLFQQLCGINTVMYYSATIIQMSGFTNRSTVIWLAAAVASVNFLCTFIGLYLVDKIGRRMLTLISLLGVTASLLLLGISFQLGAIHSPAVLSGTDFCKGYRTCDQCIGDSRCGYCIQSTAVALNLNHSCLPIFDSDQSKLCNVTDWCPTNFGWMAFCGLLLYLLFFAPGMGPMPWTINAEIYPQWARSTGNALSTGTNWVANLLVSMTFLSLLQAMTKQGAYYLYTAISLCAFLFFFFVLPETKGCSLEQVEGLFSQPWFTCNRLGILPIRKSSILRPSASRQAVQYVPIYSNRFQLEVDSD